MYLSINTSNDLQKKKKIYLSTCMCIDDFVKLAISGSKRMLGSLTLFYGAWIYLTDLFRCTVNWSIDGL